MGVCRGSLCEPLNAKGMVMVQEQEGLKNRSKGVRVSHRKEDESSRKKGGHMIGYVIGHRVDHVTGHGICHVMGHVSQGRKEKGWLRT